MILTLNEENDDNNDEYEITDEKIFQKCFLVLISNW